MHEITVSLLKLLYHGRIIGGSHTPEKKILLRKTRHASKLDKRMFFREYKQLLAENIIVREKKMTGKQTDWHISLNPKRTHDIIVFLEMNDGR